MCNAIILLAKQKISFTIRLTFESYDHVLHFPINFHFLTIIMLLFLFSYYQKSPTEI